MYEFISKNEQDTINFADKFANNLNKNSYSLLIARSMSRIAIGVPPPLSFRAIAALFNNMTLCTKSQFCFCE